MVIPLNERSEEVFNKIKLGLSETMSPFSVTVDEIYQSVNILVQYGILTSFVGLDDQSILCCSKGYFLIIKSDNGLLSVQRTSDYSFHIDNGFRGPHTNCLNEQFNHWKKVGDITQPILEPIYLSSCLHDI